MTRPLNIYLLSRVNDETPFSRLDRHESRKLSRKVTKRHEILSLRQLVDGLVDCGISMSALDGFLFGYTIPRIGKEFDLLKFKDGKCLSIELKSRAVSEKDILSQQKKNLHYLAHIDKNPVMYTVVTDTLATYKTDEYGRLARVDFSLVADAVRAFDGDYLSDIDDMFKASDYLVSPLGTPEKFIAGEYFLTQAQDRIKNDILTDISMVNGHGFYSITGTSGTGKTLLIYDVAKTLTERGSSLVIYCGRLDGEKDALISSIPNFDVMPMEEISEDPSRMDGFKFVFVDEAHRLSSSVFNEIVKRVMDNSQICIFSSDPEQVLTRDEKKNQISAKIVKLNLLSSFKLRERIRTNAELTSFIDSLKNIDNIRRISSDYPNIGLYYANNVCEARKILSYLLGAGYTFISYPDTKKRTLCSDMCEEYYCNHVIGQEFDNVVMVMDNTFYYDKNGILQGIPEDNPEYLYPNLFYQGISRVREKIAIVVVENKKLFEKISRIFD